jgi:hypothetical protein
LSTTRYGQDTEWGVLDQTPEDRFNPSDIIW